MHRCPTVPASREGAPDAARHRVSRHGQERDSHASAAACSKPLRVDRSCSTKPRSWRTFLDNAFATPQPPYPYSQALDPRSERTTIRSQHRKEKTSAACEMDCREWDPGSRRSTAGRIVFSKSARRSAQPETEMSRTSPPRDVSGLHQRPRVWHK